MTGTEFRRYWVDAVRHALLPDSAWAKHASIVLGVSVRSVQRWAAMQRIPKRVERAL